MSKKIKLAFCCNYSQRCLHSIDGDQNIAPSMLMDRQSISWLLMTRAAIRSPSSLRKFVRRAAYVGRLIVTLGATVLCGGGTAHSGPCTVQIAQLERQIRLAAPSPEIGPTAPQTLGAQLHYQPTPADVQNAESRASVDAEAALQRARQADTDGDAVACAQAYEAARHHWIFPAS